MGLFYKARLTLMPTTFKLDRQLVATEQQPQDLASLKALQDLVTQWCAQNRFLIATTNGTGLVPNIAEKADVYNMFRQHIYALNFRQLCDNDCLTELLNMLKDTEFDRTTSRLIDLHVQVVTEIDSRFLNLYINKLHYALVSVDPTATVEITWTEIFQTYPYLWLLILIQRTMRNLTPTG